jgi:glycosyltransferase involved in cell wall biosynthesis
MEIVTAGRLIEQKNQKLLIEAFAKIRENHPQAVLKIYGDGHLKEELQNLIDRLGLYDVVELCGNVSDLHERTAGAKAFVLTSEFEGLSNALIEAMMLGIPCVTTDYPGAEELIKDKKNGLVVHRGDVDGLVDALDKLLNDMSLSDSLHENCLKEAENYKKEVVISRWEKIIER